MLREKKIADNTRVNQNVCLTIVRDLRPYAVDRLYSLTNEVIQVKSFLWEFCNAS